MPPPRPVKHAGAWGCPSCHADVGTDRYVGEWFEKLGKTLPRAVVAKRDELLAKVKAARAVADLERVEEVCLPFDGCILGLVTGRRGFRLAGRPPCHEQAEDLRQRRP